jgi:hypothetical protein
LLIGFIDHLQIATTSNYSAIADSHTLQFTTARTKSSQSAVSSSVVWQRHPMTDLPLTLGSRTITVPQLPASNSNSSQRPNCSSPLIDCTPTNSLHSIVLNCTELTVLLVTSRHGPHRKHKSSIAVSIVACAAKAAFQPVHLRAGRCLVTGVVSWFVSRSLPSSGSILHNTIYCL